MVASIEEGFEELGAEKQGEYPICITLYVAKPLEYDLVKCVPNSPFGTLQFFQHLFPFRDP